MILTEYSEEVAHKGMEAARQLTEKRLRAAGGDEDERAEKLLQQAEKDEKEMTKVGVRTRSSSDRNQTLATRRAGQALNENRTRIETEPNDNPMTTQ